LYGDDNKPRQSSSPYNRLISSRQGEAVVTSLQEILRAVQSTLPNVESAFATCHGGVGTDFDDFFSFHNLNDDANSVEEEEELQQMRRLGSWSTVETMATSTSTLTADLALSYSTHAAGDASCGGPTPSIRDDDGHLIDPLLLEMRRKAKIESRKASSAAAAAAAAAAADAASVGASKPGRSSTTPKATQKPATAKPRRRRVVQFEYPPVSSLRQCPRVDPGDLPSLFFTEEELEVFEHDRESTYTADDIEIVAISSGSPSSSSSKRGYGGDGDGGGSDDQGRHRERDPQAREPPSNGIDASTSQQHPSSGFAGLGNYISTPRVIWNKKRQQQQGQQAQREREEMALRSSSAGGKGVGSPSGRAAAPDSEVSVFSAPGGGASGTAKAPRQERLIKSVQIFLRERSAG
jgi:hypothetical protein